jgi:hypothetical protein
MKWWKQKMVERQLANKLMQSGKRAVLFPKEFKSIGIIAASEVDYEVAKAYIRNLWGYKVMIKGHFFEEQEKESIEWISESHFNLLGKHKPYLNAFTEEKLDILLIPSTNLNPYLRYLLLANPTGFRLGFFSKENTPYLDLMLAYEATGLNENIQYLINYLNKIKEAC